MSDAKNIIELNGKQYDIRTGKLIGDSPTQQTSVIKPSTRKSTPGVALDGFVRHKPQLHKPTPLAQANRPDRAPIPSKPSDTTHQKTQRSQTLMRPGLKKPEKLSAAKTSNQPATTILSKNPSGRLNRAKVTPRSGFISKFTNPKISTTVEKRHAPLAVAPAPPKAPPSAVSQVSHVASVAERRFEHAIQNASSHLAEFPAKEKRRLGKKTNIFAGTLSALLLIGFFAYQNLPNIEMRVAATRAGFSAKLPGYSPAGFGVEGRPQAEPGKVAVDFKSRTDDKGFTLTQEASDWSSQTLQSEYIAANNKQVNTYPTEGKTVYLYDDSNATWVDGGVWYRIEGDASLTPDQLQRIANSF